MIEAQPTAAGDSGPDRPATDPYWDRIRRLVDEAPPLTVEQRAALRVIFHGSTSVRAEAA